MEQRLEPGTRLLGFVLERCVGRGGFAQAWLARVDPPSPDLPPRVVLKVLGARAIGSTGQVRFEKEAGLIQRVQHQNVARAYAHRRADGAHIIVMEAVAGENLALHLARRSRARSHFELGELQQLVSGICAGVHAAHQAGIVHRDLKPHNIVLDESGPELTPKLLDFGVAKAMDAPASDQTTVGRTLGTYLYMSPEQIIGEDVGIWSDVFATGSIAFELLTLRRAWGLGPDGASANAFAKKLNPAEGNTPIEIIGRIKAGPRPRPRQFRPELHPSLDELIERSTSVRRQDRPADLEEFASQFLDGLARSADAFEASRGPSIVDDVPRLPVSSGRLPTVAATIAPTPAAQELDWDELTRLLEHELEGAQAPLTLAEIREGRRGAEGPSANQEGSDADPDDSDTYAPPPSLSVTVPSDPRFAAPQSSRSFRRQALAASFMLVVALGLLIALWRSPEPSQVIPERLPTSPSGLGVVAGETNPEPELEVVPEAIESSAAPVSKTASAPPADPTRTRRRRVSARKPSPRRRVGSKDTTRVWARIQRLKSGPPNPSLFRAISGDVKTLAQTISDASLRRRVVRMVDSSAMVGDVSQLEASMRLVDKALKRTDAD